LTDVVTTTPAAPPVAPGEVHVWLADVDAVDEGTLADLTATLSSDERERADRFVFDRDRRRFACGRGVLRHLLASYVGADAASLRFAYGAHGKPTLSIPFDTGLLFNVSNSGSFALVAISRGLELGVDIEAIRPLADGDDIASRFFSPREVAHLQSVPASARHAAFFACWTRKEAYLKALGDGLALPLDTFDVTFVDGEPPRVRVADDASEGQRWSLIPLSAPSGYAAALVIEGRVDRVKYGTWTASAAGRVGTVHQAMEAV